MIRAQRALELWSVGAAAAARGARHRASLPPRCASVPRWRRADIRGRRCSGAGGGRVERVPRAPGGGLDLARSSRGSLRWRSTNCCSNAARAGRRILARIWSMSSCCTWRRACWANDAAPLVRLHLDAAAAPSRKFEFSDVRRMGRRCASRSDLEEALNMFTGIILAMGRVIPSPSGRRLGAGFRRSGARHARMGLGDSVCVQGVCLTVTRKAGPAASSPMCRARPWPRPRWELEVRDRRSNLEPSLRAGDALGGHMVSGHVDAWARLVEANKDARSTRLEFELPAVAHALRGAERARSASTASV
jgi:hypothetical protein